MLGIFPFFVYQLSKESIIFAPKIKKQNMKKEIIIQIIKSLLLYNICMIMCTGAINSNPYSSQLTSIFATVFAIHFYTNKFTYLYWNLNCIFCK